MAAGRAPARNKHRSAKKPPPGEADRRAYAVGSEVEVRTGEDGFRGSWHEATVAAHLRGRRRGYLVAYANLVDGSGERLREEAAAGDVRPRPPAPAGPAGPFGVHDMVDALDSDGWWAGVVSGVPQSPEMEYAVALPTAREVVELPASLLRPRLEFRHGTWVPAAEASHGAKPLFAEGDRVEVKHSAGTCGECWSPATVLKTIGITSFLVQYTRVGTDGELVTEILDSLYIRPVRTTFQMESRFRFGRSGEVEVLHEGKWWPGVVSDVSGDECSKKFVVKMTRTKKMEGLDVLTVEHARLRPRFGWDGKKWICCSNKKPAKRRAQFSPDKRPIDPDVSASGDNADIQHEPGRAPAKKAKTGVVLALGADKGSSLRASLIKNRRLKCDSSLNATSRLEVPPSKRISLASMSQKGSPQQTSLFGVFGQPRPLPQGPVFGKQSLRVSMSNDLKHSEGDVLPIGLKSFRSEPFRTTEVLKTQSPKRLVDTPDVMQVKNRTVDFNCRSGVQNDAPREDRAAVTARGAAEGCPPIESSSVTQFFCHGSKQSISGDGASAITPISKNTVSTVHAYDGPAWGRHSAVHESITGHLPSEPAPNKDLLPFVKSSSMWAAIEAMGVFRRMPQQPHFLPLLQHLAGIREGMAFGLMISFANLAESIERLTARVEKPLLEEKMSCLVFLEANGFDVRPLQSRLQMLLQIKNDQEKLGEKIVEREVDSKQLHAQINILKRAVLELERKANLFCKQKMSNNSEIMKTQEGRQCPMPW